MATSYNDLRRRVALLIDRDDAHEQMAFDGTTVDMLGQFISNAERRVYRDEVARVPPFEFLFTQQIPAGNDSFPVPENLFEMRYVELLTGESNIRYQLERTSVENIRNGNTQERVDVPTRFAYGSNVFYINPAFEDVTVNIYYYSQLAKINTISGDTTEHWLLNEAGDDLLLYYAAVEGALYFGDDAGMLEKWEGKAQEVRNAIIMQDKRARQSGSTPKIGRGYRNPPQISPNVGTYGRR